MKFISALAALSLLFGVTGCNQSAPNASAVTLPANASQSLSVAVSYVCPVLAGVQVSTIKLTTTQRTIINTAVSDCTLYGSNPAAAINPTTVASLLVQALVILQSVA